MSPPRTACKAHFASDWSSWQTLQLLPSRLFFLGIIRRMEHYNFFLRAYTSARLNPVALEIYRVSAMAGLVQTTDAISAPACLRPGLQQHAVLHSPQHNTSNQRISDAVAPCSTLVARGSCHLYRLSRYMSLSLFLALAIAPPLFSIMPTAIVLAVRATNEALSCWLSYFAFGP